MRMPFLRIIKKTLWLKEDWPWISGDDVPATCLGDVRGDVVSCAVSVYDVMDVEIAERAAIAFAALRKNFDALEYALFDPADLAPLGIAIENTLGVTPDPTVNVLHRDLSNMTVRKSSGLAQVIGNRGVLKTILPKEVETKITEYYSTGAFRREVVNEKLRQRMPADD